MTPADGRVSVEPFGDEAVLISLGNTIDVQLSRRVRRLASSVADEAAHGLPVGTAVCGYASLLVPYDATAIDAEAAVRELTDLVRRIDRGVVRGRDAHTPLVEVPTRYGGEAGEDLPHVADVAGLSPDAVVDLHASTEYRVFMLGFAPGFAYLGTVPAAIEVPRRATPRERVPAGSVAIAGRQTAIYPLDTPGGWNLIGRTDLPVWDPAREPPALLTAGARVRFVPIE